MIVKRVRVKNESGLDSRPAAIIVRKASSYQSKFSIIREGFRVNGKSIIGVMTLVAEPGLELTLEFNGTDEEQAAADIVAFFENGFQE
ncbi:MAG: HPr family phosphocarrier protein [Chlorobi bacterium]|nr:HPr family phosphocarrier protein [Chlorobiota bacterium]